MNPTMTACEMKRVRPPPRSSPAASIMSPVSSVSTTRPCTFWSDGRWASEAPTVRLRAAVVTMAMRWVPAVSAPTGRAGHGGVQPVHRRHAGDDGVGEGEADLRDAEGEPGEQVVGEVGA